MVTPSVPPSTPPTPPGPPGSPLFPTPPPQRKTKRSAQETRDRRMEVFKLQMRGASQAAMAKVLGVNRNTIIADVKWLRSHVRELAESADTFSEVGDAMKFLDEAEHEAMFQFHEAESPHAKNGFLMTAINCREKKIRLMMDAGIIDKASMKVDMSVDYSKLTTEELLQKREELIGRLRTAGLESSRIGNANSN